MNNPSQSLCPNAALVKAYSIETHGRKHYYNFRYLTNMLKLRSRGFDRAQYCQ